MTLDELIEREGSQEKAALYLGVTLSTVRRWMIGKKVSPMGQKILKANKVEIGPLPAREVPPIAP